MNASNDECNDSDFVRKQLKKFSKEQLINFAKKWTECNDEEFEDLSRLKHKNDVVYEIQQLLDKPTWAKISEIDVDYCISNDGKLEWQVFQMNPSNDFKAITSATEMQSIITTQMNVYFKHCTIARRSEVGDIWIRIQILDEIRASKALVGPLIYLVYFPHSKRFLSSSIKSQLHPFLEQVLKDALKLKSIEEQGLTGTDRESIKEMILNANSQGRWKSLRTDVEPDPLASVSAVRAPKRRKMENVPVVSGKVVPVVQEDLKLRKDLEIRTEDMFGTDAQPVLQKLEFRMNGVYSKPEASTTGFKDPKNSSSTKQIEFNAKVVFEGSNVLEGLKQLSEFGLTSKPLPSYLFDVASTAKNRTNISFDSNDFEQSK